MKIHSSCIRFLSLAVLILFGAVGCGKGIQLGPRDVPIETEGTGGTEETGDSRGDSIDDDTSVVSVTPGGAGGMVVTDNLIVFVRTSATSFQGNREGENFIVKDPFFEYGIDRVFDEVDRE